MDFALSESDEAFRVVVREWLREHYSGDFLQLSRHGLDDADSWALRVRWEQELASGGWVGLNWPEEVGGRGVSLTEQLVFDEEYARSGAPSRAGFFGEQLLGPTMIVHGTDAQKKRFLPAILAGTQYWCQGYSEPNAGSDLASVVTRARLDGDRWIIDGQKVWTSLGHFADWIFVLCRTDPDAPGHRGLSLLLCPLDQPGVEVRPIRQLTGGAEFNEVFFTGAETTDDLVLGAPGAGWNVAMSVLGFERGTAFLALQKMFTTELSMVIDTARRRDLLGDRLVRAKLARMWERLQIMRYMGLRTVSAVGAGKAPGPEASVGKLFWSHWHQELGALAMDLGGMDSMVLADGHLDHMQHVFLFSKQDAIAAGSSEIQHNILGERVLGLPRA
ncbi:MAG: acyl-CoA dehydrogenase family protein [Acidimicrobiia bacterium]